LSGREAEFPEKLECLFQPARYKILYGGRGGAKSWGIARALLILGAQRKLRIACGREIQKSISESVHQLLREQIEALGLGRKYRIFETYIEGTNGTLITFHGLKTNVVSLKSIEGIDIFWAEEAQTISRTSWNILIPTIRKQGSEIWISFNPELDTDETYQRFVVHPPTGAIVTKITYRDNPWFSDVLEQERLDTLARSLDDHDHVWEGQTRRVLEGAIFANELRAAYTDNRVMRVPYDMAHPVQTVWDLGRADMTAIWFVQMVGLEFRIIDYYQNRGQALPHYIKALKDRPYSYGAFWLPHDAQNEQLVAERTIEQQVRAAFPGQPVNIVPKTSVVARIDAARTIFNRCVFDADKTAEGLNVLARWKYKVNPDTKQWSKDPEHDDNSHGGDAFTYMAVAVTVPRKGQKIAYSNKGIV
jgi:phage terminase large subunit